MVDRRDLLPIFRAESLPNFTQFKSASLSANLSRVNEKFPNLHNKMTTFSVLGSFYSLASLCYMQVCTMSTKELFDDSNATMELRFEASRKETKKLRREVVNLTALSQFLCGLCTHLHTPYLHYVGGVGSIDTVDLRRRTAMGTWPSWVDSKIDTKRTPVFFRTFEPSHWSDQSFRFCEVTEYPVSETKGRDHSIFSDTMLEVVKNMTVPVNVLHITSMSSFRKDAHVDNWSDNPSVPDCSHWCLPGVPDVWNEIVLSYLNAVDHEFPLL